MRWSQVAHLSGWTYSFYGANLYTYTLLHCLCCNLYGQLICFIYYNSSSTTTCDEWQSHKHLYIPDNVTQPTNQQITVTDCLIISFIHVSICIKIRHYDLIERRQKWRSTLKHCFSYIIILCILQDLDSPTVKKVINTWFMYHWIIAILELSMS